MDYRNIKCNRYLFVRTLGKCEDCECGRNAISGCRTCVGLERICWTGYESLYPSGVLHCLSYVNPEYSTKGEPEKRLGKMRPVKARGVGAMGSSKGTVMFVASVYSHLRGFHVPYMSLLQEWGYEVIASASDARNPQAKQELKALGFQCVDIPLERQPLSMSNAVAYREICTLLASRRDIELIHVHTPAAAFITRQAAASSRFKGAMLYTAHGFHFFRGSGIKSWLTYYTAEKYAAKLTDGLITINSEDYEAAKKFTLSPGGQVYYVPGVGIDLAKYCPGDNEERQEVRAELDADPDDIVFVYVAELNHNKNQSQFLTAFREAFCGDIIPAKAWIIGEGPLRADMESLACKLGIDRKVSFLGRRNDVPELLRGADVAVLLSHREGLPRCLMEACATALPIVATDIRGNRDIVVNSLNGILVESNDVKSTASALHKLATEPHTRRTMGKKGRERVRMFGLDRVTPLMEDIYAYWLDES